MVLPIAPTLRGAPACSPSGDLRDRWNRAVLRRLAKAQPHSTKIKGRVRPQGARGQEWFSERRAQHAQSRSRTQALWNLHLAGSWHPKWETARVPAARPHLMRAMLVANLDVEHRFANGTQGRCLEWNPAQVSGKRKALPASHPELYVRFAKEASLRKSEMFSGFDYIDIAPRPETLTCVPGRPVLLQVPVQPCYALSIHKVQALSMKNIVRGCLE